MKHRHDDNKYRLYSKFTSANRHSSHLVHILEFQMNGLRVLNYSNSAYCLLFYVFRITSSPITSSNTTPVIKINPFVCIVRWSLVLLVFFIEPSLFIPMVGRPTVGFLFLRIVVTTVAFVVDGPIEPPSFAGISLPFIAVICEERRFVLVLTMAVVKAVQCFKTKLT